jgi:molybdate/tungstate transport system permease protein
VHVSKESGRKTGRAVQWARRNPLILVFSVVGIALVLFIAIPILAMIGGESLDSLGTAFGEPVVRDAIWLSISTALYATVIAVLVGVPLGYLMARKAFPGKSMVQAVIDLPIVVPHTVAGIALLTVFGSQGVIGSAVEPFGIDFVDAVPGIVVAMLFVSVPFVINSSKNGFQSVEPKLESIMTGSVMCWARAVSEFGAVVILVYHPLIAPTLIYERFTDFGLQSARPIAVLLILVCLGIFFALSTMANWKKKS